MDEQTSVRFLTVSEDSITGSSLDCNLDRNESRAKTGYCVVNVRKMLEQM